MVGDASGEDMDDSSIPTAKDVVDHLNRRFEARGVPVRIDHVAVLPYVNPMWMANWDVPQLDDAPDRDVIDEELREARWLYPQVLETFE